MVYADIVTDRSSHGNKTRAIVVKDDERLLTRAQLTVADGPDKGQSATLESIELSIGTAPGNDLVLSDRTVSRHHFTIRATAEGFAIRDLDSTNGTFVEGVRVLEGFVAPGAIISAGGTSIRFDELSEQIHQPISTAKAWSDVLGTSAVMRRLFALLPRIAESDSTILLEGETGTGKGLLARAIHEAGPRARQPFSVLDCSAIPPTLIESELFGHEKGAFTGAHGERKGVFTAAAGGTVFLDEIGELPLDMQPKLLRALEERVVRPVGSTRVVDLDVRVIAATNRDLRKEVNRKTFRADLFYRLNVVRLEIPPLRERREDIPLLAAHFYRQFVRESEDPRPPLSLLRRLAAKDWPGNVRELRAEVERAVLLGVPGLGSLAALDAGGGPELARKPSCSDDPEAPVAPSGAATSPQAGARPHLIDDDLGEPDDSFRQAKERAVARWERRYIAHLLTRTRGNISGAARSARMDRNHLRELIRKHGVDPKNPGPKNPGPKNPGPKNPEHV